MRVQECQSKLSAEIADETTKNFALTGDFLQAVLDDPALLDQIPNHATIVFIPEGDAIQARRNIKIANDAARDGRDVWLVRMGSELTAEPLIPPRRDVG